MADGSRYALGFVDDLPPGDVDDGPAGNGQPLIALSILLEGRDRAMHTTAVGFDDEPSVAPHEVGHHRDTVDHHMAVHLCRSEAGSLEQPEELLLEPAPRLLFLRIVIRDSQPETSDSSSSLAPLQQLDQAGQIEDTFDFGLIHRVPERPRWLAGRDVKQSASEAGAWDTVDHHPIGAGQRSIPMRSDPTRGTPASIWSDDIDFISRVVENAMEVRSGSMRQNRSWTTGENSREQMSFPRNEAVPNGVNALLNSVKAPSVSSLPCQIPIQVRQLP